MTVLHSKKLTVTQKPNKNNDIKNFKSEFRVSHFWNDLIATYSTDRNGQTAEFNKDTPRRMTRKRFESRRYPKFKKTNNKRTR